MNFAKLVDEHNEKAEKPTTFAEVIIEHGDKEMIRELGGKRRLQQLAAVDIRKRHALPFVVAIDTREQLPYAFESMPATKADGGGLYEVEACRTKLDSGDYSIVGLDDRIAIERKSKLDLYGTLGKNRARFERELSRLDQLDWAAVVVEADWFEVLNDPPYGSQLLPLSVQRSVFSWSLEYPRVHWFMCSNRVMAEETTFTLLRMFAARKGAR